MAGLSNSTQEKRIINRIHLSTRGYAVAGLRTKEKPVAVARNANRTFLNHRSQ